MLIRRPSPIVRGMERCHASAAAALTGLLALAAACSPSPAPSPIAAVEVPSAAATPTSTPSPAPPDCAAITAATVEAAVRALAGWTSVRTDISRGTDGSVSRHSEYRVEFISPDAMATTNVDLLRWTRTRNVLIGDQLWRGTAAPTTVDGDERRNIEVAFVLPRSMDGRFELTAEGPVDECVATLTDGGVTTTYWMTGAGVPIRRHVVTSRFDEELTFDPTRPDSIVRPGGVPRA
jgi:hypothetical protein